jgi:hypothetical protein
MWQLSFIISENVSSYFVHTKNIYDISENVHYYFWKCILLFLKMYTPISENVYSYFWKCILLNFENLLLIWNKYLLTYQKCIHNWQCDKIQYKCVLKMYTAISENVYS